MHACVQGSLEKLPVVVEAAVVQGLQAALPAAVRAQVGGVVAASFRAALTGSIVPAFEQAMHTMFKQVRVEWTTLFGGWATIVYPSWVPRVIRTSILCSF